MPAAESDKSKSAQVTEELVAYLDGEMEPEQRCVVEERLAHNPAYRRRLGELDQAWEILDYLPQIGVDDSFTRTTVEMIAVAAEDELQQHRRPTAPRRIWKLVGIGGLAVTLLVAAGIGGFVAVNWFYPDENQRIVRDLPILENFELYQQIENVEFLEELSEENLFPADDDDEGIRNGF
jgi:hypothetical protein